MVLGMVKVMCAPDIGLGIVLDCMTAHYIQVDLLKLIYYYNRDDHVFGGNIQPMQIPDHGLRLRCQ
jgi:hypothetical protein